MKKTTIISLVTATLMFTACGEETKKAVDEINKTKVAEAVKKDTVSAFEEAKTKMTEAAAAAKVAASQMAEEAKVEAEKMAADAAIKAEELKAEAAAKATEAMAAIMPAPPAAYDKCKGCHGDDGKTAALGKSAIIAGQSKEAIIASMNAYKAGTKNEVGMGALMKGQAASMSDEDIEAVAEYLSKQ